MMRLARSVAGLVVLWLGISSPLALAEPPSKESLFNDWSFSRADFIQALAVVKHPAANQAFRAFYRRPAVAPPPRQHFKHEARLLALGQLLFQDPLLSRERNFACISCHKPEKFWIDGRAQSIEGNGRRSMSLENLAWDRAFTWNGRAGSVASQSVLALGAPMAMRMSPAELQERLKSDQRYNSRFREAFGDDLPADAAFSADAVVMAIEYYVNSIVTPIGPFDRWVGGEEKAISDSAKRGFGLFNSKARCAFCHNSWRFSDGQVYDIGLGGILPGHEAGTAVVRDLPFHFKAVGLRNIANRPPYMHDGRFSSLAAVIAFYDRGGDIARPSKSPFIQPIGLSDEEKRDLEEFLKALSGPPFDAPQFRRNNLRP